MEKAEDREWNRCFEKEIKDTVHKTDQYKEMRDSRETDLLRFCILTDTHYTENGIWEETEKNIRNVVGQVQNMDAIVHLGDFTDGVENREVTSSYTKKILSGLRATGLPVYITVGNHDFNYFKGNTDKFSKSEMKELFGEALGCYYRDFEVQKIRCLFLPSCDIEEPVRYGFSKEDIAWVRKTLESAPSGYKVLVFAHEAPLDRLDYWSRIIRGGKELLDVLETYNASEDKQILAYIHGHTHAEHVYRGSSFPIISIGCNKCENVGKRKPEGSYIYDREPGTVSQDLWDVLLVDAVSEQLHFIRFGAGEDRTVDCHKSRSTWREEEQAKKDARTTKIWALRGSSGFAPENTLPAFEVAKMLNIDGITIGLQTTKDGYKVVISDETIDRTSDGKGYVKDYTLEELRVFNFAKDKPNFGFVTIPTYEEVLELFRDTDFEIWVEGNDLSSDGRMIVWDVSDEAEALRLRDQGVDVIVTKNPGKMRELFANK